MIRTKSHNQKIGKALRGKPKSEEHRKKLSEWAKNRLSVPENNPNYRGDKVGYIGIHIWLRKTFGHPKDCEHCGLSGNRNTGRWNIVWALRGGLSYERKKENFIGLCNKCHRIYDKSDVWNKNISIAMTKKGFNKLLQPTK